jgi:hypothetical protein
MFDVGRSMFGVRFGCGHRPLYALRGFVVNPSPDF